MRDIHGDLWGFADYGFADVVVVTTNGSINRHDQAVMGRGCAKQAAERFPEIRERLALLIRRHGNRPFIIRRHCDPSNFTLVSMPVKHQFFQKADPALIVSSAELLVEMADNHKWQSIVLPRAGCGNGHLHWEGVKPLLAAILDDRFTAVTFDPIQ